MSIIEEILLEIVKEDFDSGKFNPGYYYSHSFLIINYEQTESYFYCDISYLHELESNRKFAPHNIRKEKVFERLRSKNLDILLK